MNKKLVIIVAAAGIVALSGFGLWLYGQARYDAGHNQCQADAATAAIAAGNESAAHLDKVTNETARMSDADVDADLVQLGIMRPSHAR